MSYIPIVTEPYPDEMLYSWIHRLSKANGLSISVFGRRYLNLQGIFAGELPYDIRHEFVHLCGNMLDVTDREGLYLKHSSFLFDSLFRTKKTNCRIANNITLHADEINPALKRDIRIYACPECIKEDMETYGEPYLHVRHHIGDTCYCRKHKTRLMKYTGKRSHECEFRPETYTTVRPKNDMEYEYSCFVDDLYQSGITGSVEDLKRAVLRKFYESGYGLHGEGYDRLEKNFNGSNYQGLLYKSLRYCLDNYFIKKKAYPCCYMAPLLMFLFENTGKLKEYVDDEGPLLKNAICTHCKENFLSIYDTRYSMGLCPDCYMEIPLEEKFENIISVANDSEYRTVSSFSSMNARVNVLHSCGRISSMIPRNLIYGESRCPCKKAYDDVWHEHYKLLLEYRNEYGTSYVPKRGIYKDFKLGEWCQKMRKDKANGILPIDREIALIEMGFDFTPTDSVWDKSFSLYREIVSIQKSGHISRSLVYKGVNLGEWYANNRKKYLKGDMPKEQADKMKSVNPDFPNLPLKPVKEEKPKKKIIRFEEAVDLLLRYKEEFGTMNIPKRKEYGDYKLGIWANQMRSKHKQGILPKEQIDRLNKIGFDWDPLKTKWKRDIARYRRYVNKNGKTEIPKDEVFEDFSIGYWYSNLKISRKNNSLSDEQQSDILKINPKFI